MENEKIIALAKELENSSLVFDTSLMTDSEKRVIIENWDGEVILRDDLPKEIVVGVHDGMHHADEALCIAMLRLFFEGDHKVTIKETREDDILSGCHLRCDVGEGLLDHHGSRADKENSIAACSRVYTLIRNSLYHADYKKAWSNLATIVAQTAAVDCGNHEESPFPWFHKMATVMQAFTRKGEASPWSFGDLVDRMTDEIKAQWFLDCAAAKAEKSALEEIAAQTGEPVVVFSDSTRDADVKRLLWEAGGAIYFVSPETEEDWRVLCCAKEEEEDYSPFSSKHLIPEEYRGLRGDDLSKKTGIPGGIFCHAAGFIAGFKTRESAVKFAQKCVEAGL